MLLKWNLKNYIETLVVVYKTNRVIPKRIAMATTAFGNRMPSDGDWDWHSSESKKKSYFDCCNMADPLTKDLSLVSGYGWQVSMHQQLGSFWKPCLR